MSSLKQIALLLIATTAIAFTPVAVANVQQENVHECINYTVATWGAPRALLLAVHEVEGGKPGTIAWNRNRTYDMGPMQFNSSTVAALTKYGVNEDQMRNSECASIYVAGWKLSTSARKFGDWLLAIAAYNCGDGCIAKAIGKRNGSLAIDQLDIPHTTKTVYVPKVMAAWGRYAAVQ